MATGRIILPIGAGVAPDGSGTGNNPAQPFEYTSAGTQTTNTPKLRFIELLFDQTTDEHWIWNFPLPKDYASGGTLLLLWGGGAIITGNVVWKAGAEIIDLDAQSVGSPVYNAADSSGAVAVPGTAGYYKETSIALTMTGASAGEWCSLFMGRDADNGSDTAAGDVFLFGLTFEYTTT